MLLFSVTYLTHLSFSGFVFLRLICPAILNPRMFNIIAGKYCFKRHTKIFLFARWRVATPFLADPPSSAAGRTLTLVAKSVQNLANLVEFGAKVWMMCRHSSVKSFALVCCTHCKLWVCPHTGAIYGGRKPLHQKQQTQDDHVSGWIGGELNILCLLIKPSEVSYSLAIILHCLCRMFLTSLKPQSTLGRTCPGTWLHCTRSVPHTRTNCGRWATRGERSRSETSDVVCVHMQDK